MWVWSWVKGGQGGEEQVGDWVGHPEAFPGGLLGLILGRNNGNISF